MPPNYVNLGAFQSSKRGLQWPSLFHCFYCFQSWLAMNRFEAEIYLDIVRLLTEAEVEFRKVKVLESPLEPANRATFLERVIRDIKKRAEAIKLTTLVEYLNLADKHMARDISTYRDAQYYIRGTRDVLIADVKAHVFLQIDPDKRSTYLNAMKRMEVLADFSPETKVDDLVEAHLCYALERYPACVHHLMIAVEDSLRKWARRYKLHTKREIDVEDWGKILGAAEKKLDELNNLKRTTRRNKTIQHLSATTGHFSFINDGYRKPSAHGKEHFNESAAKTIMNHVEAFMGLLATKPRKQKAGKTKPLSLASGLFTLGAIKPITLEDFAGPGVSAGTPAPPAKETP